VSPPPSGSPDPPPPESGIPHPESPPSPPSPDVLHCLSKLSSLLSLDTPTPRALFQLGYNLGRLSELTPGGRELFWNPWKTPVETWDQPRMRELLTNLSNALSAPVSAE
jgi:hypothetical protein